MNDGADAKRSSSENFNAEHEEATLSALAEAIQQLTPDQRRRLLRRLRTSGLLENDELLTDRDRMQIAPALGMQARRRLKRALLKPRPTRSTLIPANPPREVPTDDDQPETYRSAVRGKVVVGAP